MRAPKRTFRKARHLRRRMTPPEVLIWSRLRDRHPGQPSFRRQHPIGPYILDFYCPSAKLAVEIDGWSHSTGDRPRRDDRRDAWLLGRGIATLRISAREAVERSDEVVEQIKARAIERIAAPTTAFGGPPPP